MASVQADDRVYRALKILIAVLVVAVVMLASIWKVLCALVFFAWPAFNVWRYGWRGYWNSKAMAVLDDADTIVNNHCWWADLYVKIGKMGVQQRECQ